MGGEKTRGVGRMVRDQERGEEEGIRGVFKLAMRSRGLGIRGWEEIVL
ncbi:MAG: hypothetical protein JSW00_03520 [Thermoplasmata archaeon]|nr:MAG: hypothetical protein JSW00_03520 [Thermoplasmata archaeon]